MIESPYAAGAQSRKQSETSLEAGVSRRENEGRCERDPSVSLRGTCRQSLLPLQRPGGGGKSTAHAGREGREPRCIEASRIAIQQALE